jgi:glycosyltransferase involved in cell wall biosynthesis
LALLRRLYPRADAIVAVSDGVAEDMCRVLGLARSAVTRIYNPVVNASLLAKASEKPAHPWFSVDRRLPVVLACGSLTQKKGFDYLIRAVAHLQRDMPARLVILGEGEQRAKLRELAEELHVQDKVAMPGFQDNPYGSMARADVFVLSSLWEGLGNVVIEAMACGAPVVSTDCPSGPAEIITHNVDGILVPPADSNALSAAILSLLRDERLGQRLARAGRARAADFRVSKIVDHYQDLFAGLVGDQADR